MGGRRRPLISSLCSIVLFVATCAGVQDAKPPLDPALKELSKFVGGTWESEGGLPISQHWTWNTDQRGLSVVTQINKGAPTAFEARAFLGWDAIAKKPYYLDMHNSETTYYGHVGLKDRVIEFKFGILGSGKTQWVERGKFTSADQWESTIFEIKEGKEVEVISFKLKRKL